VKVFNSDEENRESRDFADESDSMGEKMFHIVEKLDVNNMRGFGKFEG
jgi:hypothetical protein